MKVLFVGDGSQDLGSSVFANEPRPAVGVIPTLARKIVPTIAVDSLACSWVQLSRWERSKRGYAHKMAAAVELARRHGCQGTVCVVDQDKRPERREALTQGRAELHSREKTKPPVAVGVAVESIEAWALGAPDAIAAELSVPIEQVCTQYVVSEIEDFYQNSGRPEHRPKDVLQRVAQLGHRDATTDFRICVAERSTVATLRKNCPIGFAPFADDLLKTFLVE